MFYELAIRHASKKAVIQIMHEKQELAFDISHINTVLYDFEIDKLNEAKQKLIEQIKAVKETPNINNPITVAKVYS